MFIINCINNNKYNINSKEGKRLLIKYIKSYIGGASKSHTEINRNDIEMI